jgi:hypothetical protein
MSNNNGNSQHLSRSQRELLHYQHLIRNYEKQSKEYLMLIRWLITKHGVLGVVTIPKDELMEIPPKPIHSEIVGDSLQFSFKDIDDDQNQPPKSLIILP